MNVEEIRALSNDELDKRLEDSRKELFELRFKLSTRQLVNHREVPRVKKEIARLLTIRKERELGIR